MTKLEHNGYIYKVTNIITGEFYIGQRSSYKGAPEEDLGIHYFTSSKIVAPLFKSNTSEWKKEILYRDIKYAEKLDRIEGFAIHRVIDDPLCLNGYDPSTKIGFTTAGKHLSEETKRKLSEAQKNMSDETKRKLSEAHKGMHLSEETKRKLAEANKGHKISDETKLKISEAQKGKHLSEEAKRKLAEAQKGKHPSEETKRKISEAVKGHIPWNKGKHSSEEHKRKISEAVKASLDKRHCK